jgi:lipid-A-disaccharide synthase
MRIGMLAGEASGDNLGAGLMQALRARQADIHFSGIGGARMIAAGFHSLHEMERLSVMGLIDPLKRLPELWRIRRNIYQHFLQQKPAVFVGIDSPAFNLGLELKLKRAGIPTVQYVSPSVWAWRQKRIHTIARATNLVLALFPFEVDFYHQHNVPVCFVGHPLADSIPLQPDRVAACKRLGLDPAKKYLAVLPGSRASEIQQMGGVYLSAALQCCKAMAELECITSTANPARAKEFEALHRNVAFGLPLHFFSQATHDVLEACDVVLVTSGTATLEAMLFKKPMVIAWRTGALAWQLVKRLVKTPWMGLPNILAGETLVPEFVAGEVTAENLARAVLDVLSDPARCTGLQEKFLELHKTLRCNASEKAAEAVLDIALSD